MLEEGLSALDAVETAVKVLEDDPLFNAGRGSALSKNGAIEMEAAIMDGGTLQAGAVALVSRVRNPVSLARAVMKETQHVYLGGPAAVRFATEAGLPLMPESYFVTDHAVEQFLEEAAGRHGTVGAVALDQAGNLAAATSTGGIENKMEGRIGDSSIIGTGAYANNKYCAVSATGDGEVIIPNMVAFHVSAIMRYARKDLQDAARDLMQVELAEVCGDIGFIALDVHGDPVMEFNSERMHRGWRTSNGRRGAAIYPNDPY